MFLSPGTVTRGNHTQRTTTLSGLTTVFPTVKSTVPISTAKVTTRNPILPNENYNDPCISSQKTCSKNCGGSYVKGNVDTSNILKLNDLLVLSDTPIKKTA